MQLTRFSDYALRTLIYVALRRDQLSTIADVADTYDISRNHLMKVANRLVSRGYLDGVRGKNGGLRLKVPADQIVLGRLVREMEPDMNLVECFQENCECRLQHACSLAGVLNEALQAFLAVLDRYTLADILHNEQQLARLLAIRIPTVAA
ncbi:Rrf2 family transcriptional regulator [Natronospirillum operosum]|uniref:Rrf2 family transcriptional regulator n=1 Tax=Natronospirillum operosum TaxID=2759953 RepID=A0A4Z0W6D3_9GAMM|nr:Rrf2 family transcriptional regulator [Natronospirillum operosum]TGG92785.1 Rrf2 family transcriptional regulator [Natronospirillum operosum]